MCVLGLPALGSQVGTLFGASLGINLASNLVGRSAAQQQAAQVAQQSQIAARSAEQSFANQQGALAEQLKETEASKNQERLAATIRGLQARGRIQASERAGLTASNTYNLLVRDAERQAANERNSIGQTLDSFRRQYSRNIQGLETQRNNRLNELQGNINQAYNQVPSLGSVLLNTAASGVTNYLGLLPSPKLDNNVLRFSS